MRLTTKSQYGLKALGILATTYELDKSQYVQLSSLSRECAQSQKYLEQVLAPLVRQGLLESRRGQHGGYRLKRAPEAISLAEALGSIEGLLLPLPDWAAVTDEKYPVGKVLQNVQRSISVILEETSIKGLASPVISSENLIEEPVEKSIENSAIVFSLSGKNGD
jgi:Rrf2 family protein